MEGKAVGIWIRVSTEDQAKGESPETHLKRAQNYAEAKGWVVKAVYRLDGVSGKAVMAAAEAKRMIEDVRRGHITGLIFSKLARLARNTKELLEFSDIFRAYGADLISLKESIDTSSPAGRLYYTIISAMAQWEREEIAERVADAIPIRAREGKSLGGQAPYGYRWENKVLVIDEDEAAVRRQMFELFIEHKRKRTVAKLLNQKGYRTRKGAKFTDTTLKRLLTDPLAKGSRRVNYTKSTGQGQKWSLKPIEEWVMRDAPAIVTEEQWKKANMILAQQATGAVRLTKQEVHLFTGVLNCACGSKMYLLSNTPKYVCPSCRRKIHRDDLEAIFQEQLRAYAFNEVEIDAQFAEEMGRLEQRTAECQQLRRKTRELEAKLADLLDLLHSKQIPKEGFNRYHNPLFEQLTQVQRTADEAQTDIDLMRVGMAAREEAIAGARTLYDGWSHMDERDKRSVIETIVESITVDERDISIILAYVSPEEAELTHAQRTHRGSWRPRA